MDLSFSQKIRISIIMAGLLPWCLFMLLMLQYSDGPAERLAPQIRQSWQQLNHQLHRVMDLAMLTAHLDTPLPPIMSGYWEKTQGGWQGGGSALPLDDYRCEPQPYFATQSLKPEQLKLFACQRLGSKLRLFIFDVPTLLRQLDVQGYQIKLFYPVKDRIITLNGVNSRLILLPMNKSAGIDTAVFRTPKGYLTRHGQGYYWDKTAFGWTLYLSSPLPALNPSLEQLGLFICLTLGLILLQGWTIGILLRRRLNYLGHAFARIALGDANFRLPIAGKGEFHQLNLGFNHMLDHLQRQQQQLDEQRQAANDKVTRLETILSQVQQVHNQLFKKAKMTSVTTELSALWSELAPCLQTLIGSLAALNERQQQIQQQVERSSMDRKQVRQLIATCAGDLAASQATVQQAWQLVVSRIDGLADAKMCEQQDLNLYELLLQVQHSYTEPLRLAGHSLYLRGPHDLVVHSNPQALQRIFANLIEHTLNQAFATHTAGEIIISIKAVSDEEIQIQYRDNGAGIPLSLQEQLFEPFTGRQDDLPSGLGLYLIHELVIHLLGGRIACNSTPSQGTEFLIWLPRPPL